MSKVLSDSVGRAIHQRQLAAMKLLDYAGFHVFGGEIEMGEDEQYSSARNNEDELPSPT